VGIGTTVPLAPLHVQGSIFYSKGIINVSSYVNSSRVVPAGTQAAIYYEFNITKLVNNSILYIQAAIPTFGGDNEHGYFSVRIIPPNQEKYTGITSVSRGQNYITPIQISQVWCGLPVGTLTIGFKHDSANGISQRPINVLHPNSTDDGRFRQQGSEWIIFEILN
jgi:hypothetical protein